MSGLVLIVVLGINVLVGTSIGGRYRVAPPVLLICLGALLALWPPLSDVVLEPDVVLLLFLPALLYRESIAISLREVRATSGSSPCSPSCWSPSRWSPCR